MEKRQKQLVWLLIINVIAALIGLPEMYFNMNSNKQLKDTISNIGDVTVQCQVENQLAEMPIGKFDVASGE